MTPANRLLTLSVFLFSAAANLLGQVSPGVLSRAHHSLDSPLKCASCHTFGTSAPRLKCQGCHREILDLVARRKGYHGRVTNERKGDIDCARCHTEHYGENFSIIRWPDSRDTFDHRTAGYPLEGKHAHLKCEQCHNPQHIPESARKLIQIRDLTRTYMGMSTACLTCHEDWHEGQLGADCRRCHDYSRWKPLVSFDHSTAKFPLTGRHAAVPCAKCHLPKADNPKVIQYTGLNFAQCSGCHQDPHHGAFAARCESCHNTTVWKTVTMSGNFNHDTTKFPLTGKHVAVACEKCHKTSNFKTPVAHEKCMDCHEDQHHGQFSDRPDHGECGACHTDKGFRPSTFTEATHQTAAFKLTAKHQGVLCGKCHPPAGTETNYHPAYKACRNCHLDPHGGQFAGAPFENRCEGCHTVWGFQPSTFSLTRHQDTRFELKGAHAAVSCLTCHRTESHPPGADRKFRFGTLACTGCHQDPHRDEFPGAMQSSLKPGQDLCQDCHQLQSWHKLKPFDHSTTNFELAGAHGALACMDCHRLRNGDAGLREIPFKTAPEQCAGCHEDIHAGQFDSPSAPAECSSCHGTVRWVASKFDHEKTKFSLTGAHANVPCHLCHQSRNEIAGRQAVIYKGTPRDCKSCHQ